MSFWPLLSFTTKQRPRSSIDQDGGTRPLRQRYPLELQAITALLNAAVLYRFEQQNQCCDNQRRASAEKRPDKKNYFLSVIEPIEIADALRPR